MIIFNRNYVCMLTADYKIVTSRYNFDKCLNCQKLLLKICFIRAATHCYFLMHVYNHVFILASSPLPHCRSKLCSDSTAVMWFSDGTGRAMPLRNPVRTDSLCAFNFALLLKSKCVLKYKSMRFFSLYNLLSDNVEKKKNIVIVSSRRNLI